MTPAAAARIRSTYAALAPRIDAVVDRFYGRLFDAYPEIRAMFPADMSRQKFHLAASLAIISRNIRQLEGLEEPLMQLGVQHAGIGARPEHYPILCDGLVEALRHVAGPAVWTEQIEADWREALNLVSAIMLRGSARAALEVANSMETGISGRSGGQGLTGRQTR